MNSSQDVQQARAATPVAAAQLSDEITQLEGRLRHERERHGTLGERIATLKARERHLTAGLQRNHAEALERHHQLKEKTEATTNEICLLAEMADTAEYYYIGGEEEKPGKSLEIRLEATPILSSTSVRQLNSLAAPVAVASASPSRQDELGSKGPALSQLTSSPVSPQRTGSRGTWNGVPWNGMEPAASTDRLNFRGWKKFGTSYASKRSQLEAAPMRSRAGSEGGTAG